MESKQRTTPRALLPANLWFPRLFVDFVNGVAEEELEILAEGKPRLSFGIFGDEVKIFLRAKLNADAFRIRLFLNSGVGPLILVEEKAFAGDKSGLLRVLHEARFSVIGEGRGCRGVLDTASEAIPAPKRLILGRLRGRGAERRGNLKRALGFKRAVGSGNS